MPSRSFHVAVCTALLGCSSLPGGPGVDAGPVLPACEVLSKADAPVISEGGRLSLEMVPSAAVVEWSLIDAGPFTAEKIDPSHLQLKAPYGRMGVFTLAGRVDCGDEKKTQEWTVTIRALSWSRVSTWTEGVDGPLNREYGSMWVDDADPDRVLLFAGYVYKPKQFTPATDLWEVNLVDGKWKQLTPVNEPPHFVGGRMALAPESGQALYSGGLDEAKETPYQLSRFSYRPGQLRWESEPLAADSPRQGDYQPGFFYDAKRSRYLSICGANNEVGRHCLVRSYTPDASGGRWAALPLAPGATPPARNGHFYAYDAETDRFILFGGDGQGTTLGDTWALELAQTPARWVQLTAQPAPMKRRNGAYVLDPVGHRFVIFGGTVTGATSSPEMWALDLDRGKERWERVLVADRPPDRTSGVAVYDAKRQRIVMGFGNSEVADYPDLWALQL
ncbi:MAG: hypothetical protein K1X64_09790 [Myxococcaceae bacterium]|nr:hypothetical protein [Myxococcaceae bacterium]